MYVTIFKTHYCYGMPNWLHKSLGKQIFTSNFDFRLYCSPLSHKDVQYLILLSLVTISNSKWDTDLVMSIVVLVRDVQSIPNYMNI